MFMRSHLPPDAKEVRGKFLEGKTVNFDLVKGPDGRAQGSDIQITAADGDFVAGEVKSYSERHGYGFIKSSSLTAEVRFNRSELDTLAPGTDLKGELVIAKVFQMSDGKLRAEKVMFQSSKIANRLKAGSMIGFGYSQPGKGGYGGKGSYGGGYGGKDGHGGRDSYKGGYKGDYGYGYGNDYAYAGYVKGSHGGGYNSNGYSSSYGAIEDKLVATQGVVISFNASKGYGFIRSSKAPGDVYFKDAGNFQPGAVVAFNLKINKDGKPSALDVQPGITSGQTYAGSVKAFDESRGYGFITVPNHLSDVYFIKDLVPSSLRGSDIVGKQVRFTVQVSADGKPRAEQGAEFL